MIKVFLILFALVFSLTGCVGADYIEPENRALITALIIDSTENYEITAEVINVKDKTNEGLIPPEYLSGKGNNLKNAFTDLQKNYSKNLSLYHCPLIVCQNDIYINDFENLYGFISENSQISLAANLVVSDNCTNLIEKARENVDNVGYKISEQIELKSIQTKIIDIMRNKTSPAQLLLEDEEVIVSKNE